MADGSTDEPVNLILWSGGGRETRFLFTKSQRRTSKFSQWYPSHRDTHLCSWTIMNLGVQSVPNPNPSPPKFPPLPPTVPSSHNKQAVFPQCATQTAALSKWNTHSQGLASFLSPLSK